jgi:heat shock protein HslJ
MKTYHTMLLAVCMLTLQCKSSQVSTSTPTFENTHWRLAEMNGNPIITLEGSRDVHIMMSTEKGEKRIQGFAGCNSLGGGYTLSGDKVKFNIVTTKMMCADEQMAVEDFLLGVLSAATSYKVNGDKLELVEGDTTLAIFKAIDTK